jgi:hypothetical protein
MNQTNKFARRCNHLTRRKVRLLIAWERWQLCGILLFVMIGLMMTGIALFWRRQNHNDGGMLPGGLLWTAVSAVSLFALPQKRTDQLQRNGFFALTGDIDTLHERLKHGAEHILLETDTLVLTEDYLIRQNDLTAYVPYDAISAFYFGYGGGDSADLAVAAKGRTIVIPIRQKDRSLTDQMRQIIEAHAPQAEYGLAAWLSAYSARRIPRI